jgi:PKD repeat protein
MLTVSDTTSSITDILICNNLLPYNWNGVDYTSSGTYTIVLPAANENGCDSTATLNLVVKDTSFSITNVEVCNNLLPYNWNGVDYTASGSYTIILPAANENGCDSTATLNLTVKDTSFSVTNVEVCNNLLPYNWNGVDYTTSGSYTIILPASNENSCDSTATLNLTVKDTSFSVTNVEVCNNLLPYNWNGVDYTTSGSYTIVLPAANENGCDSTATLNLIVTELSITIAKTYLSCIGESNGSLDISGGNGSGVYEYSINGGINYQPTGLFENLAEGSYTMRVRDSNGCFKDSTVSMSVEKAIWTGASDNNWHNASNWSTLSVPSASTHVIIPPATPECIISEANAVAASIQVLTGAQSKIENNREIIINGQCATLPSN